MVALAVTAGFGACGGSGERQDVDEPSGEFPVQVATAKFPNHQRLAEENDLELAVKNTGDETIPDLAVTIFVDQGADGPFSIRSDQPGLANPNRPVWILAQDYPKLITPGVSGKELDDAPSAGAEAAQTNTFSFGSLAPGDTVDAVWRVTAVKGGTYTVNYEIAASLTGKAKAVTNDGSPVKGSFVVTVSEQPPRTKVNSQGEVVPADK